MRERERAEKCINEQLFTKCVNHPLGKQFQNMFGYTVFEISFIEYFLKICFEKEKKTVFISYLLVFNENKFQ